MARLATFDHAIIEVTEVDELPFAVGGTAKPGPAFITRREKGGAWGGSKRELKRLANPDDLTLLVIFDTWTLNWDRYCEDDSGKVRIHRDNVFLSAEAPPKKLKVKAMDHTHCFTRGHDLTRRLDRIDNVKDKKIYGLFPEFRPFFKEEAARGGLKHLDQFSRGDADRIVQAIPKEWQVGQDARKALVRFLVSRAVYVVETFLAQAWPQGKFGFMVGGENPS